MVVPNRCLPHVRMCADRRGGQLSARTAGVTGGGQCADLLLTAPDRHRDRSLVLVWKAQAPAWVQVIPWGPPSTTTNWLPLTASWVRFPVAAMGRIRSASP